MNAMVTVLIPFYNTGRHLLDAILSVYSQTYSQWKIVLVDDASTDNSLDIVSPFLSDPRVSYLRNPINLGQSKSLNAGLRAIDTPYFVQLDADDWFYSETLGKLMAAASNTGEDTALISGNINIGYEDENGQVLHSWVRKGRTFTNPYEFLLANSSVWPRCYRTSAVKGVGGWPVDDLFEGRYVEDIRILLKLIPMYQFAWVDELMLYHRRHQGNNTNDIINTSTTLKYTIEETLKSWGDIYKPVFKIEGDYLTLDSLVMNNGM